MGSDNLKYNKKNCPKSLERLERGGKCGWEHECDSCVEYRDDEKEEN